MKLFLVAALIAVLVCGTALAATTGFRLSKLFSNNELIQARMDEFTQEIDKVYETENVRITVTEGLYSFADSTIALALTVENKKPGERYYLMARNFTVNGELLYGAGQETQFTEALLEDTPIICGRRQDISDNDGIAGEVNVEFDYTILRVTGKILPREEMIALRDRQEDGTYDEKVRELTRAGYIVIEDDMVVETGEHPEELSYMEQLIATGNFELADQIHVRVPLNDALSARQTYEGETRFPFEGVELVIDKLEVGLLSAHLEMRVIVDDPGKYENYWIWANDANNPLAKDKKWNNWAISSGSQSDFALREDGRYESLYKSVFILQEEMPEALEIRFSFDDPQTGMKEERAVINFD